jgi:hypothetical protein
MTKTPQPFFDSLTPEIQVLVRAMNYTYKKVVGSGEWVVGLGSTRSSDSSESAEGSLKSAKPQRDESRPISSEAAQPSRSGPNRGKHLPVDTERLLKLAAHHKLRPVLLAYDREVNVLPPEARQKLELQCTHIIAKNLRMVRLYHLISEVLTEQQIPVLPLKGNLFLSRYYQNQQLREIGDLDILIPPEYILQASDVLRKIGVNPDLGPDKSSESDQNSYLHRKLNSSSQCEAKFKYQDIHVDVHWELTHPHYLVGLNSSDLFSKAAPDDFFGKQVLMPHSDHTFWMLVAHHGGKENWTRLRHILDMVLSLDVRNWSTSSQIVNNSINSSQNVNTEINSSQNVNFEALNQNPLNSEDHVALSFGLERVYQDGHVLAQWITGGFQNNPMDEFSSKHRELLILMWENQHSYRSKKAIIARQRLRFLRRSKSVSLVSLVIGYINSVIGNRIAGNRK